MCIRNYISIFNNVYTHSLLVIKHSLKNLFCSVSNDSKPNPLNPWYFDIMELDFGNEIFK